MSQLIAPPLEIGENACLASRHQPCLLLSVGTSAHDRKAKLAKIKQPPSLWCSRAQADMVLSSIGYRSEAIEGVAFDARRGVVMHR